MQKIPFNPTLYDNFTFSPIIDGETYFCSVEWLSVTQRWWLKLTDSTQLVICYQPLIASSDCKDVQLFATLNFKTNIVYRASAKQFEIDGVKRDNCPEFIPTWLESQPVPFIDLDGIAWLTDQDGIVLTAV